MEKLELEKLWAKTTPFQSVEAHAIVAGTVAQVLLAEYLSAGSLQLLCNCLALEQNKAVRFVGYLASLHDIGKIEPHFQAKDEEMRKKLEKLGLLAKLSFSQQTRHEKTTRIILSRIWEDELELFADILASHHQGKSGDGKRDSKEPWRSLREELEQRMRVRFWGDEELPGVVDFTHRSELSAVLLGVIILADWIASGTQFADAEDWVHNEDADVYIREKTAQFLTVSGLAHQVVHWGDSFCGVWPNIPSDGLRSLQQKTQELFSKTRDRISVVLMEAPMGEGKTEAGLYAALQMARQWGKDGFYVALPTAATSNQMVGRMRHLLKLHHCEDHVKLLHGMAWLTVTEDPQFGGSEDLAEIRRWLQPRKRGLLAPYAVGTVDQVMMAVCNVKYGVLRLLGLSQKVLIIDEIHSYDVYMSRFIHLLLKETLI